MDGALTVFHRKSKLTFHSTEACITARNKRGPVTEGLRTYLTGGEAGIRARSRRSEGESWRA